MHLPYKIIQPIILPVTPENWLSILQKPIFERPCFALNRDTLVFGQVVVRFLGMLAKDGGYERDIFKWLSLDVLRYVLLTEEQLTLPKENTILLSIHNLLQKEGDGNFSLERFICRLGQEKLIPDLIHPPLQEKIKNALSETLTLFSTLEQKDWQSRDLLSLLGCILHWSSRFIWGNIHCEGLYPSLPKYFWIGDFQKEHAYFIFFLMEMGCDLVILHPGGKDMLSFADPEGKRAPVFPFSSLIRPDLFPGATSIRKATPAYRAEKEIESMLHRGGMGIYKRWQLRDSLPHPVTLKTTYDEIFIIGKEPAAVRPAFQVSNGTVSIPCLFAKIQGVNQNRREYWNRLHSLCEMEPGLTITRFPFAKGIHQDIRFHYKKAVDSDGLLNVEKMMSGRYWKYRHLPFGLQKGIAHAIKRMCAAPALKPAAYETEEEVKSFLFTHGLQLPGDMLKLLQRFDYSREVPKLILYNNGMNGQFSRGDAAVLLLLNQMGIDILIFNPAGGTDIESFIDVSLFDVHWLDDLEFELEFKPLSPARKFWRKRIAGVMGRWKL